MMRNLALALLLAVCPVAVRAAAPVPQEPARETFDVRYHPGKDRHLLDVFTPAGPKGVKHPVVFYVHGGSWMIGDKNHRGINRGVGRYLAKNGYVAVLINYRLSPQVKHPAHVRDVARAFAWTYRNVEKYGGDPGRITLMGHSAGAHLASLLATDVGYLKDPELGLDARAREAVRGVVVLSGVYRIPDQEEFGRMSAEIVHFLVGDSKTLRTQLVGTVLLGLRGPLNPFPRVFGKGREVQEKASPISHVHKGLPPFLILTAEEEVPGLHDMADDFAAALRKVGTGVEQSDVAGCNHRTIVRVLHRDNDTTRMVLGFLGRVTSREGTSPQNGG